MRSLTAQRALPTQEPDFGQDTSRTTGQPTNGTSHVQLIARHGQQHLDIYRTTGDLFLHRPRQGPPQATAAKEPGILMPKSGATLLHTPMLCTKRVSFTSLAVHAVHTVPVHKQQRQRQHTPAPPDTRTARKYRNPGLAGHPAVATYHSPTWEKVYLLDQRVNLCLYSR